MRETLRLSWCICIHHWKVYRKNIFSNSSTTLIEPVFFVLAFGVGLGGYLSQVGSRSFVEYLAPGLAAGSALITSFFEASYSLYFRLSYEGIYKGMLTSPIGVREIILGEFIWLALKGAAMSVAVFLVLAVLGLVGLNYLWIIPFAGAGIALSCGALGVLATTFVKGIDQFQLFYSLMISPIYFLSGIFFPIDAAPLYIKIFAYGTPLFHGVRLMQAAAWKENILQTILIHGSVLVLFSALLVWWASVRFSKKLYLV